jgi:hypothetical protein
MRSFITFLSEQVQSLDGFGKLKHLEHVEDLMFHHGEHGYHRAKEILDATHAKLSGKESEAKITTKYDGSPAVVFGRHPKTGKFFVGTKSVFNKTPKINYTPEDIEKNHGHAPGLVQKLKHALEHLPKAAPRRGVYQGDLMYSGDDVSQHSDKHHFTPNTITYSTPKDSDHGKKVAKSKLGIVVHTKYHGSSLESMEAGFDPDTHRFKDHDDVHLISHHIDHSNQSHPPENKKHYDHHMEFSHDSFSRLHPDAFGVTTHHKDHMLTYINHTVRTGEPPTSESLMRHVAQKHQKRIDALKSESGKKKAIEHMNSEVSHISKNKKHFDSVFELHGHLQRAKNSLIRSLETNQSFEHTSGGKPTNPEGYVVHHKGYPSKLVDRSEFSRLNFEKAKD